MNPYETPKKIMTGNQTPTSKRGGPRPGSGRTPDYLKKCQILAIQVHLGCSESTARRQLRDNAGRINGLVSKDDLEFLSEWPQMTEFDQGFAYGHFITRVVERRKRGIGVRF
jgi:hypothetical protein